MGQLSFCPHCSSVHTYKCIHSNQSKKALFVCVSDVHSGEVFSQKATVGSCIQRPNLQ